VVDLWIVCRQFDEYRRSHGVDEVFGTHRVIAVISASMSFRSRSSSATRLVESSPAWAVSHASS
jgi:hypothetical protein